MAFGTGHHATTRTCLELLERHLQAGCALLDVGTGSGVLAIAALRLGAERAVGVDVDPLARAAAAANAARNGVADRLRVRGSLDEVDGNFAAATANLQLSLLVELETRIAARLLPDGLLVASGLLREEIEAWRAVYAGRWREVEISGDREWVTVASHRRKSGCGRP
jgi:ribosomal protein L11 methyltransferase